MKAVIWLSIVILIAGVAGFFAFDSSISEIGVTELKAPDAQSTPAGQASSGMADSETNESSLSSMSNAMPRATRVDPDLDIYKLMGIRQVTEEERQAYREEMEQIREENKSKEDEPLEIDIKKVAPGKYQMTNDGLKPLDPNDENPGVIMVVPEPESE